MEVVRFNDFQTTQPKVSHRPPTGHPSSICKYINTCLRITFAFGTKNLKRNSKQYELVIALNQLKTVPAIMKNTMKRGESFWGACGVTRARELGDHARESAVTDRHRRHNEHLFVFTRLACRGLKVHIISNSTSCDFFSRGKLLCNFFPFVHISVDIWRSLGE